ncbi:hypothetical protein DFQ27_001215, partial [Actinomortierella ambigua]
MEEDEATDAIEYHHQLERARPQFRLMIQASAITGNTPKDKAAALRKAVMESIPDGFIIWGPKQKKVSAIVERATTGNDEDSGPNNPLDHFLVFDANSETTYNHLLQQQIEVVLNDATATKQLVPFLKYDDAIGQKLQQRSVEIHSLHLRTHEDIVRRAMSVFGTVQQVNLKPNARYSALHAVIVFESTDAIDKLLKLKHQMVFIGNDIGRLRRIGDAYITHTECNKLAHIPFGLTQKELANHLETAGVPHQSLVIHRFPGRPTPPFAFVYYASAEDKVEAEKHRLCIGSQPLEWAAQDTIICHACGHAGHIGRQCEKTLNRAHLRAIQERNKRIINPSSATTPSKAMVQPHKSFRSAVTGTLHGSHTSNDNHDTINKNANTNTNTNKNANTSTNTYANATATSRGHSTDALAQMKATLQQQQAEIRRLQKGYEDLFTRMDQKWASIEHRMNSTFKTVVEEIRQIANKIPSTQGTVNLPETD